MFLMTHLMFLAFCLMFPTLLLIKNECKDSPAGFIKQIL